MSLFKDFLHLIFPNTCAGCENSLATGEEEICIACLSEIEETQFHLIPMENELYFRFAGKVPLNGAASLFYFDKSGRLQKIISQLKYHHQRKVAVFLGKYYGMRLKNSGIFLNADVIVPVPLHPKRQAERGYNQAEEFAKGLSFAINTPIDAEALKRVQATSTQTRKGREERWQNVKEVFEVTKPVTGNIILVDDVITTGATLESCAVKLWSQDVKPASVSILSIACTRRD